MINIDSNVYGNKDTWVKYNYEYGDIYYATTGENLKPEAMCHTIGTAVMNGKISRTYPNTSICPIATDSNSFFTDFEYVEFTNTGGIDSTRNARVQTPVMFVNNLYYTNQQNSNQYNRIAYNSSLSNQFQSDTVYPPNSPYVPTGFTSYPSIHGTYAIPIAEWQYRNIVMLICVCVKQTEDTSDFKTFCLKDYIENRAQDYPYVFSVYAVPFILGTAFTPMMTYTGGLNLDIMQFSAMGVDTETNVVLGFEEPSSWFYNPVNTVDMTLPNSTSTANLRCAMLIGGTVGARTRQFSNGQAFINYCPDMFKIVEITQGSYKYAVTSCHYNQHGDFREFCLKQCAYLGMFFTDDYNNITKTPVDEFYTNENTYMGLIDKDGITHGTYSRGAENATHDQFNWKSMADNSPYDYQKKPDNNVYDDTPTKILPSSDYGKGFANYYIMNTENVDKIMALLGNYVKKYGELNDYLKSFLTFEVVDCIPKITVFPFNIRDVSTITSVNIGNITFPPEALEAYRLTNTIIIFDMGTIYVNPEYNDFRDVSPYTNYLLYIPYCSSVEISGTDIAGKELNVKLAVNTLTGSCQAYIFINGFLNATSAGICGFNVEYQNYNTFSHRQDIINEEVNVAQNKVSALTSALSIAGGLVGALATGGVGGVIGGALIATGVGGLANSISSFTIDSEKSQNFEVRTGNNQYSLNGISTSNTDNVKPHHAILFRRTTQMMDYSPELYAQNTGYACLKYGTISEFSGLCQFTGIRYECPCTKTERNMINEAFQNGVIL